MRAEFAVLMGLAIALNALLLAIWFSEWRSRRKLRIKMNKFRLEMQEHFSCYETACMALCGIPLQESTTAPEHKLVAHPFVIAKILQGDNFDALQLLTTRNPNGRNYVRESHPHRQAQA